MANYNFGGTFDQKQVATFVGSDAANLCNHQVVFSFRVEGYFKDDLKMSKMYRLLRKFEDR